MRTYAVVYFGAAFLAVFVTPVVIQFARRMGVVDHPGVRKVHSSAIPRGGGIAIVFSMLAITLPVFALDNRIGEAFRGVQLQVGALLAASVLIFLIGLMDDVRDIRARTKFLGQIVAALIVCSSGARIEEIALGSHVVQFGWMSWPLTVFWIIAITNAVNLIDGLDGLAAGISTMACAVIAVFAVYTGQPVMAVLMFTLLGSLSGFLFFNFNPAKIFMGDCGSMFLGFVLGSASVICSHKTATIVGLGVTGLALGIPIFDTLFSMVRRMLERRSLFAPDRGHIHHRLLAKGVNHRNAVMLMFAVTLLTSAVGLFMMILQGKAALAVFVTVLLFLVIVFRLIGAGRLYASFDILRRNMAISRNMKEERRRFQHLQLRMHQADSFDDWWSCICSTAERLDLVWVALNVTRRNGTNETLVWRPPGREFAMHEMVTVRAPVCQRRTGPPLQLELGVRINGSLESAGRRAALFVRLLDQYSLTNVCEVVNRTATVTVPEGRRFRSRKQHVEVS